MEVQMTDKARARHGRTAVRKGFRSGDPGAAESGGYFNLKESFAVDLQQIQRPSIAEATFCCSWRQSRARARCVSAGRAVFVRFSGNRAGADPCPLTWTQVLPHERPRA